MIEAAISQILTPRIVALGWMSQWGGLTRTAIKIEYGETEQGETYEAARLTFPVSCSTTFAECWDEGKYAALSPDTSKASVAWLEWLSPVQIPVLDEREGELRAGLRLVMWLNLAELGVTGCDVPMGIQKQLLETVTGTASVLAGSGSYSVTFTPRAVNLNDYEAIFGKYSFDTTGGLFLYPYGFLAIDFEVKATYWQTCIPDFTPATRIECYTL